MSQVKAQQIANDYWQRFKTDYESLFQTGLIDPKMIKEFKKLAGVQDNG